jgi:type II restriction enzyme
MNLKFDISLAYEYHNNSQIARVLTEHWVYNNMFCPYCGNDKIYNYENNRPVADFHCLNCNQEYELKSKNGKLGTKIVDGSYNKMIERITETNNPNFFFMTYNKTSLEVNNFVVIPKHFFIYDYIEKRKPLSPNAKRVGWTGCNILLNDIPKEGKIYIIQNQKEIPKQIVLDKIKKTHFLSEYSLKEKGWLLDTISCIDRIHSDIFTLGEIYQFENELKIRHPKNNYIKEKLRQQLQLLRDKGIVDFVGRGKYRKL